jgi:hypothetical protein
MKKPRRIWLLVSAVATVLRAGVASGQANSNYVYYNPNLDVYAKPDVSIWCRFFLNLHFDSTSFSDIKKSFLKDCPG